jgi:diacylglycerol O-acyltransferase / wax synthase
MSHPPRGAARLCTVAHCGCCPGTGNEMTELFPYIPLGSEIRITIGIATYAGQLNCGVTGDYDAVPDLQVLCDGIQTATEELFALVC